MASRGVHVQLSKLLNIPDTTDIVNYIESFQSKQDLEEYLYGLLDENDETHRNFVDGYLNNWKPGVKSAKKPVVSAPSSNVKMVLQELPVKETQRKSVERSVNAKDDSFDSEEGGTTPRRSNRKSKTKYSPLFATKHGYATPVMQLPGQHRCDCEATKHKLINNCRHCGKIVCEQEGAGPCTFCGNMVRTKDEQEVVDRDCKSGEQLMKKLLTSTKTLDSNDGLRKALEHKDKLLEFDQTVEKRTKIIDDQSDYYTLDNLWLTKGEREAIRKREKDVETQKKFKENVVTFDFAGRKVVEERGTTQEELQRQFELHMELLSSKENTLANSECNGQQMNRPIYESSVGVLRGSGEQQKQKQQTFGGMRLQGSELQEMNDQGWCLSLHQPYASLLVAGLKMHEGRSWYSAVRGRLWIASTAQQPPDGLINKLQDSIRAFRHPETVTFPVNYPVGALLGCVNLIDCLSQEEYREKFSVSESDSPFVFICANPRELLVKFPIRGQHKIYKLDTKIHDAAKKTLKVIEDNWQKCK